MGRVFIAFRAFFAALFNGAAAARLQRAAFVEPASLHARTYGGICQVRWKQQRLPLPKPQQSDAITLLATLQREAGLV